MRTGRPGVTLAVLLAVVAAGCGDEPSADADGMTGRIAIAAADTSYPFAQAAADQFQIDHPGVTIAVHRSRPSDATRRLCNRAVALVTATRQIDARTLSCADGATRPKETELVQEESGRVHLYEPAPGASGAGGAFADFVVAHHEGIARAAADGRRALRR